MPHKECFGCEAVFEQLAPEQVYCTLDCETAFNYGLDIEIEAAKKLGLIDADGNALIAGAALPEDRAKAILAQFHLKVR